MIPYSTQFIDEDDIQAVERVLKSDFLTGGPKVADFEDALCSYTGASYGVAVSSATAALHIAVMALGVGPEDEVWVSAVSFVASANCARYCGAAVRFIDVDRESGNLDVHALAAMLKDAETNGKKLPKAVIAVHLSGRPCELRFLENLKQRYDFALIEDASHALGATYENQLIGNCRFSDITVFSFHPVKIITSAEGGACMTENEELFEKMCMLRSHGITHDADRLIQQNMPAYYYEQQILGYNYRMSEMQAALGLSQLNRIESFLKKRRQLAADYAEILDSSLIGLPVPDSEGFESSWHLYQIRVDHRDELYTLLRSKGIGVQIHYLPIYAHPYYQTQPYHDKLEGAEYFFAHTLSIPLHCKIGRVEQSLTASVLASGIDRIAEKYGYDRP